MLVPWSVPFYCGDMGQLILAAPISGRNRSESPSCFAGFHSWISSTWIVEPILSGHSVKEGVTKFKTAKPRKTVQPPNHWIDRINQFVFFDYFVCFCCTFQACPFHLVKVLFWFSTQVGTHLHQPSLPSFVHQVPSRICPR